MVQKWYFKSLLCAALHRVKSTSATTHPFSQDTHPTHDLLQEYYEQDWLFVGTLGWALQNGLWGNE